MVLLCSGLAEVTHQESVTHQKNPNIDFIAEGDSVVDQERSLCPVQASLLASHQMYC